MIAKGRATRAADQTKVRPIKILYMSGFQLLENGNYLVTLGVSCMVMEMTPDKKVLWRFFDKKVVKEGLPDTNLWPYQSIFKANAYPKMW